MSGASDVRPGLQDALAAVRFNGVDGIVVASLDRLARSLSVQEAALQQVWAAGGIVFAVDSGEVLADDPDDPLRTFVRQVVGGIAQFEAAMISKRLRMGRQHKAESGGYAHGAPPFGWRAANGALLTQPDEQAVVDRIRGMRGAGSSYREIASELNREQVPAKRGGTWHPQTVARVVK